MSFTLEKVVPWVRSFDEYAAMFSLSNADLDKRILGSAVDNLNNDGYKCTVKKVTYEFQRGGNKMLRVKSSCKAN